MVEPLGTARRKGGNGYVLPNAHRATFRLYTARRRFVALQNFGGIGPKATGEAMRTIACPHPKRWLAAPKLGP